ncbi:MAG TPA: hypothetical protein VF721_19005 [Pyrinomonadaceae bacterium]|jgi:transcription elongation GreA/GreB family factor
MNREETEQIYRRLSEEERILTLVNADEAFRAIQDEANHLAISENISEEVHEVLNRIEALARHRYDFRTEEQKERVKSPEFRKSV